ncbi:MAG: hypothetical protein ACOCXH_05245 [Cyclobacteriaceae bacterium]
MKKPFLSFLFSSIILFACEGPMGPQGDPGAPGPGAFAMEFVENFSSDEDYAALLPYNFEIAGSDVVLVYLLDRVEDDLDFWRLMPQTYGTEFGDLTYNFDYTIFDAEVFLESNFDRALIGNLGAAFLLDQIFRVVVIPADLLSAGRHQIDFSNYQQVKAAFNIDTVIKKY